LIKSVNIRGDAAAETLESAQQAATIAARFNRLPASRYTWQLIALLSLCGFFEIYEIALTSTLSPGLIRAGIFNADAKGSFGLTDQASFAAATFLGLFIGTSAFAAVADRLGRRAILLVRSPGTSPQRPSWLCRTLPSAWTCGASFPELVLACSSSR